MSDNEISHNMSRDKTICFVSVECEAGHLPTR